MTRTKIFKSSEIPSGILDKLKREYGDQPRKGTITKYPSPLGWLDKYPSHEAFIAARNRRVDIDQWFFNNGVDGTENHAIIEWD